jgi:hypothetical protein
VPWYLGLQCCSKWAIGYLRGKYHCTVDLLFDWFGISCMTADNFCFYLQNRLIQTNQTGGQWYSDTSPFSIHWDTFLRVLRINEVVDFRVVQSGIDSRVVLVTAGVRLNPSRNDTDLSPML